MTLKNLLALRHYNKKWEDLTETEQLKIKMEHPKQFTSMIAKGHSVVQEKGKENDE